MVDQVVADGAKFLCGPSDALPKSQQVLTAGKAVGHTLKRDIPLPLSPGRSSQVNPLKKPPSSSRKDLDHFLQRLSDLGDPTVGQDRGSDGQHFGLAFFFGIAVFMDPAQGVGVEPVGPLVGPNQ